MKHLYYFTISFFALAFFTMDNLFAQDIDLKSLQWENRIVLIIAENENNFNYQKQIELFQGQEEGLADRKLVVFEILPDKYRYLNYTFEKELSNWINSSLLYQQFSLKTENFQLILIGLDGGIKLNQNDILLPSALYGRIDAMPMRGAELRRRNKN